MNIRIFLLASIFFLALAVAGSLVEFGSTVFLLIIVAIISSAVWGSFVEKDMKGRPIPMKDLPRYGVFISLNHFPNHESAGGQSGHIHLVRDNRGRILLILSEDPYINNGKSFRVKNGKPVDFADATAFAKEVSIESATRV